MVLVGEKSLQQQVLQAVPENGVAPAPFETVALRSNDGRVLCSKFTELLGRRASPLTVISREA
jgi:hypothetical protein